MQSVARPERGGGCGVVAHGDGDGLALLGRQHVELDADQLGLALGAAAACVAMVIVSCIDIRSRANQLEKLEAAKPAYLWIPLDTFGYLCSLSFPYLSVLFLTFPYLWLSFLTFGSLTFLYLLLPLGPN